MSFNPQNRGGDIQAWPIGLAELNLKVSILKIEAGIFRQLYAQGKLIPGYEVSILKIEAGIFRLRIALTIVLVVLLFQSSK